MKRTYKEAIEALKTKGTVFRGVFSTPGGKEVLKSLEDTFDRSNIFDKDPYVTAYNCGQRDILVYIKEIMEIPDE